MCGIAGTLISPGRTPEQLERIKELFTANLIANEQRGREAAGVAILNNDSSWQVDKAPLTASRFVETDGYTDIMASLSERTTLLLGHTREPTKGSPKENVNNHPIIRGNIVGVHNGTIANDDFIFSSHAHAKNRIGSVDSEAIFALLDGISGAMNHPSYAGKVQDFSRLLVGSYTILYFNPALPWQIYLLKYKNPISVHWSRELGALFFSSRYLFLRKAFGKIVITEALPGRTGFIFDARCIEKQGKQPCDSFSLADEESSSHSS